MSRLMVLGLGDILHHDKGLGFYAVRDLHRLDWPEGVIFADETCLRRQEFSLQGCECLIIIEARHNGHQPGTPFRFSLDDTAEIGNRPTDPLLVRALTVCELMGQAPEVVCMGLEPEDCGYDVRLSPTLTEAYSGFLSMVRREIEAGLGRLGIGCPTPVHEA